MLLPFQGVITFRHVNPGCRCACPGLCAPLGLQPALAKFETQGVASLALGNVHDQWLCHVLMLLPFQVGCSKSASKFDSLFAYFEPENHWNTTNVVYVIWAVFEHFKKRYQKANTISLIYNTLSAFLLNIWVSFLKPILNTLPFRASLHFIMWTQGVASLALGYVLHWAFSPPLLNPRPELLTLKMGQIIFSLLK